jgi:ribonuclease P protein component
VQKGASDLQSNVREAGSEPGVAALMNKASPRRGRLSKAAEFERVYRSGRSVANRYLVLYLFSGDQKGGLRLGLSVPRRVGGAVVRNKVKRLIREAFGQQLGARQIDADLVVLARADAAQLAEKDGLEGFERALGELLAKVGLKSDHGPDPGDRS